ncbi:endo alpha-1,4 polygalactosaminidase [Streptomyces sp. NPDC059740]|uniref:endo alpha-1,4 polygalactosaminidase n=1 Tax=Streptomyces sp. NPDC059740 TaxID=3346926 RepID=UPI003655F005
MPFASRLPLRPLPAAVLACCLSLAGCATSGGAPGTGAPATAVPSGHVAPPEAGAGFDYQIGGAYRPAAGVTVVSRDRTSPAAAGHYNVCYVNAYQAQPDAVDWWRDHHPDLLLRDHAGHEVVDEDWQEPLLDISTPGKRTALLAVERPWIEGCAKNGFQAVEPDNLDSYTRSHGLLDKADAVAFARLLTGRAHAEGLAVGQKNTTEVLDQQGRTHFDFAVAEECAEYDECGEYARTYHEHVLVVEYTRSGFHRACEDWGSKLSVVLRDRDVTPRGKHGHVFARC